MSSATPVDFFDQLPPLRSFKQVLAPDNYRELPHDWWLVITDIVGSTKAINAGRYREINSLGGCTIAAVLNAAQPINLPYVFGGDGASFCIPPQSYIPVRNALLACQELARESFQLELRIGMLPYKQIQPKAEVWVGRYLKSKDLQQAIFVGQGLTEADRLVKQGREYQVQEGEGQAEADFSGFECRWQRIPSPLDVTVSLIVQVTATQLDQQFTAYQQLLERMQAFLGDDQQQQPLSLDGVRLSFDRQELSSEARVKNYQQPEQSVKRHTWRLRLQNLLGRLLMGLGLQLGGADWGRYKSDLILNSDYRKFDGVFRSVFAAKKANLAQLRSWLDEQHQQGNLYYGLHVSDAAQLTCLVKQTGVEHLHFVDGCDGGYALAARELKQQLSRH